MLENLEGQEILMATEIKDKGIEKQVLEDYYINHLKIAQIAKKYELLWSQVGYFIEKEETEESDLYSEIRKNESIQVHSQIKTLNTKLWDLLTKVEVIANNDSKENILKYVRVIKDLAVAINEQLVQYVKVSEVVHRFKEQENLKQAILQTLNEVDPEVGNKILEKLRILNTQRQLLG